MGTSVQNSLLCLTTLVVYEPSSRARRGWRGVTISTPRMFKSFLIVGDSAVRLLITLGARSGW